MKKFAIATMIAVAATAASALEVGVTTARDYTGTDRNAAGVTVGEKFGAVTLTAGFDRTNGGANDQDRFSLVGPCFCCSQGRRRLPQQPNWSRWVCCLDWRGC